MNLKVSVIMPVYNAALYLREGLNSVANQTLKDIEIICVDDGSTDDSLVILNEFAAKDSRFTIIAQENSGASVARNKGIAIAKGEYLSVLDADDFFELNMLERAYQHAEKLDADVVVFRADHYLQESGEFSPTLWTIQRDKLPAKECFSADEIENNIFRTVVGWSWDKLFKRSFIEERKIRFQEIALHNDLLFVYSAYVSAQRIAILDEVFVHQRKHTASISAKCIAWWCVYDSLKALETYLKQAGLYTRLERDYKNYVLHLFYHMLGRLNEQDYQMAHKKMGEEWLEDLGIFHHDKSYYYFQNEYHKAIAMRNQYVAGTSKNESMNKNRTIFSGLICCYRENGFRYTFQRVFAKFKHF